MSYDKYPSIAGRLLSDIPDETLGLVGQHLDGFRRSGDPFNWLNFAKQRFSDFFRGGTATDLEISKISQSGNSRGGTCGYFLLRELAHTYGITVERLVQELEAVGLCEALKHILPVVPPSIAIHPCNVSARIGARVTFTVRAHAECFPRPHYQWYKREGGRWYIINNENSCQLVRRVAGLEDQNVSYSCKVYSPDDKSLYETSHEACIIIDSMSVTTLPPLATVQDGHSATLSCEIHEKPENFSEVYQWYRNGKKMNGEMRSMLVFEKVGPEDGGEYTCQVSSIGFEPVMSNAPSVLSVVFRPKFVENPIDCVLHFGVGTRAAVLSVQCEAMQGCHLTYTWYHNGNRLESSGSGRLHFNEGIKEENAGQYQCRVRYDEYPEDRYPEMESRSAVWIIRVTGGNSGCTSPPPVDESMTPGFIESDFLPVAVEPQGPFLSQPTPVSEDPTLALGSKVHKPFERFSEVETIPPDEYRPCRILRQPLAELEFTLNTRLVLQVEADGMPLPMYEWCLNGLPLPTSVISNRAVLEIENFQNRHIGVYTCTVRNRESTDKTSDIRVRQKEVPIPAITQQPLPQTVQCNGSAELSFHLDNDDGVKFQWYRRLTASSALSDSGHPSDLVDELLPGLTGPVVMVTSIFKSYMYWCKAELANGLEIRSNPATVAVQGTKSDVTPVVDQSPTAGTSYQADVPSHHGNTSLSTPVVAMSTAASPTAANTSSGTTYNDTSRGVGGQTDLVALVSVSRQEQRKNLSVQSRFPCDNGKGSSGHPPKTLSFGQHDFKDYSKFTLLEKEHLAGIQPVVRYGLGSVRLPGRKVPMHIASCKIAVLIANSKYENFQVLGTPENDVCSIKEELEELGFHVLTYRNLTKKWMEAVKNVICFLLKACPGAYLFFFYAGHGFEYGQEQFLVPIDAPANPPEERDVAKGNRLIASSIRLRSWKFDLCMTPTQIHVVVLDCCRTNVRADKPLEDYKDPHTANWILLNSCLSSTSATEKRADDLSLFVKKFRNCLATFQDRDESGQQKHMEEVIIFFNTVLQSIDKGSSRQDFEMTGTHCRPLSLADPVVDTESSNFISSVAENLHCNFLKVQAQEEPKVCVQFVQYMSNCVVAYCTHTADPDVTVTFQAAGSKLGGASCSNDLSVHQYNWFNKYCQANRAVSRFVVKDTRTIRNRQEPALLLIGDMQHFCGSSVDLEDLYVEVKCSTPSQWKDHELDVVTHRLPVNCHEKMLLKRANIGGSLIYELNDIKKQLRSKGGQWSYEVRHDNSGNCEGHGLHYSIRH